jgi:hypothetical protein
VQWFRSPNAYRNDDITEVAADDDLTYRTKVCYMCRVPALRRPIRNFAIQSVIHTLGLGSALDKVVDRNEDVWELTFPSDPTSYLISADDVHRCPICTAEVDLGECSHCSLTFSDIDGDEDFGDGDEDDENEAMAVLQNTVPRLPREPLLIDDEAEDDDPETDYGDDLYWGGVVAAIGEDTVDDMSDDMSDEMEGSFDGDSDDEGRSFASSPPPRARGERGGRRAGRGIPVLSQAVDENEDGEFYGSEGDDGYESSFIDDDENAVHLVGSDDDEEYSEDQVDATTAAIPSSDVSDDEFLDEPTVNDLRARRAARFA